MSDLWNSAHPWLRELVSYEPGKPIEDVARELGLECVTDDTVGPGSILATADGRLSVDATLEQHLLRTWPDEAIRVGARLEALR